MVVFIVFMALFTFYDVCPVIWPGDHRLVHAQQMQKVDAIFSYHQQNLSWHALSIIKKVGGCIMLCFQADAHEADEFEKALKRLRGKMYVPIAMMPFRQDECALCLEPFDIFPVDVSFLRCGHYFHAQCAFDFIKNECPSCRFLMQYPYDCIKVLLCND